MLSKPTVAITNASLAKSERKPPIEGGERKPTITMKNRCEKEGESCGEEKRASECLCRSASCGLSEEFE